MIYEQAFLPVLVPALTTGGTIALAAAVALAALVLIRRRRAASAWAESAEPGFRQPEKGPLIQL
jgi:MYXO-CTERM domain-containing protein